MSIIPRQREAVRNSLLLDEDTRSSLGGLGANATLQKICKRRIATTMLSIADHVDNELRR